jgi:hypothetical protein
MRPNSLGLETSGQAGRLRLTRLGERAVGIVGNSAIAQWRRIRMANQIQVHARPSRVSFKLGSAHLSLCRMQPLSL